MTSTFKIVVFVYLTIASVLALNATKLNEVKDATFKIEPNSLHNANVILPETIVVKNPEIKSNPIQLPEKTVISTQYGDIEGFVHIVGETTYGPVTADIFLGVPYAQPPVDKLRFEKPEAATPYLGGRLTANKFAPGCASFLPLVGKPFYDEDCLYLNVFAPPKRARNSPNGFPVLVFIHGGGFSAGDTHIYGYKEFAANFVSRGIVVVTIQYRLGMFGFMSSGDKILPGNLGLWDQRQSLLWINENIRQFGGDPSRITLWGQNSGSASVGALSLSKWTRDLFLQSIEMSGSVFAEWAVSDSVVDTSRKIAKFLSCPTGITKKMKNCLKKKTVEEIAKAGSKLGWRRDDVNFVRMQMRFDNDFFDKDLDDLLAEAPRKPTIQGINSQESLVLTLPFPGAPKSSGLIVKPEKLANYSRNDLVQFIQNVVVPKGLYGNQTKEVQEAVIAFYADYNVPAEADSKFYLTKYTQILSDMQYNVPTLMEVSKKSQENWPVYLYLINYMNPNIILPAYGVYQTYEFPYLYGFSIVDPPPMDDDDFKFQKVIVLSLAHFVITGNPSSPLGIWPAVNSDHPFGFFDMRPNPVLRDNLMLDRFNFWTNLAINYPKINMIRNIEKLIQKTKSDI